MIINLEWNGENRRKALNDGLGLINRIWSKSPDWPSFTVYHLMELGLPLLRRCIEDEGKIAWSNPRLEMIFPINYLKDLKAEGTEENINALVAVQHLLVLQAITQNAVVIKENGVSRPLDDMPEEASFSLGMDPIAEMARPASLLKGMASEIYEKFRGFPPIKKSGDQEYSVWIRIFPLVLDRDEKEVYFPVHVGLKFDGESPGSLNPDECQELWNDLHDAVKKRIHDSFRRNIPPLIPVRCGPPPQERLDPYPIPREGAAFSTNIALHRGLGQMFSKDSKVPDLSLTGKIAIQRAEGLFMETLEKTLDDTAPGWSKSEKGIVMPGKNVNEAKNIWEAVLKKVGNDGLGIVVATPHYKYCGRFENNRPIKL